MKSVKTISYILILTMTTWLVVACGGGGGGDDGAVNNPPASGVKITQANAEAISAEVVDSVETVEGISGGSGILTRMSINAPASGFNYPDFFVRQLGRLDVLGSQSNGGSTTREVIPPTTENCSNSGSLTISGNVSDPDVLSAGDTITITFNNCNEFGVVLNGTMSMTITQITANFDGTPPFTLGVDVVLNAFSVNDGGLVITGDGDMSMLLSENLAGDANLVLSGNSLTASTAGEVETLTNYQYDIMGNDITGDYSIDLSGTIVSTEIGGSVSFVTTTTFTGNDFVGAGDPTAGVLLITTSIDNSQALLIAQPDGINIEIRVDADGDGTYETSIMTTWAAL